MCCSVFGSLNLTTVKLSGVGSSFQKHIDAESKGIKAHFNMDESGGLLLDRVSFTSLLIHLVEHSQNQSGESVRETVLTSSMDKTYIQCLYKRTCNLLNVICHSYKKKDIVHA